MKMADPENPQRDSENTAFVFHDAAGRRWPRVKRVAFALGMLLFAAVILFVRSLLEKPELRLPGTVLALRSQLQGFQKSKPPSGTASSKPDMSGPRHTLAPQERDRRSRRLAIEAKANRPIMLGFSVNSDKTSLLSLKRHAEQLTHLSPRWFSFKNENCELEVRNSIEVENFANDHGIKLVPLLTNFYEGWRGDLTEALVTGPEDAQRAFIEQVIGQLKKHDYAGITVDFEEVDPVYTEAFNNFLIHFAERCHEEKRLFLLRVPVGWDAQVFDLDRLAEHVDFFVAMLYDENSQYDPPGPIASQPWFERWLKRLLEFGTPQQWIIGLGAFGCDWAQGGNVGKVLGFADVMAVAEDTKSPEVNFSAPEFNPTFSYRDEGIQHTVWFLDAVTALNQARTARAAGVAGLAVWRLGGEDPHLWEALALPDEKTISPAHLETLEQLDPQDHVTHIGEGEIVYAEQDLSSGLRRVTATPGGLYTARYLTFPSYTTLQHYGQVNPQWIALTFDDGPDKTWTPRILDILRDYKIHATFFVVGRNAEKYPDLVWRMFHEGHEIGVHTYTHPNLATISDVQVDLELNATQRLLESLVGRSSILFRPPYAADSRPQTYEEALPILRAQKLGYLTICENIDPEDWSRPGAETILNRVKQQRGEGSVVLLHDGGGDRSQTVEALPRLIRWLRSSAANPPVNFVTASQLLGLTRDDVMPPAPQAEHRTILTSRFGLGAVQFVEQTIWAFMIVSSVLVILRTLAMAGLAVIQKSRSQRKVASTSAWPPISVMMAAFNEEKMIVLAIRSVLDNGYPGTLEVVVVDDGSRDRTSELVQSEFGGDPRVCLYRQHNAGKSAALARAFAAANHDLIISLDADTQFAPGALRALVEPLVRDARVGAVSGNAKVGNRGRWLTEFQSLEYICGFNLDRRAYDTLNCITVVPGAVGAYRRQAVEEAGGISAETLAEDTDLTLHIRKNGWRIAYAAQAVGWTESPETLRTLARQRFRWAFGTLQCLWKHRDALFNPRYGALGWVALPSLWFFQIGLVAAAPLVDFLMIVSLFVGNGIEVSLYFGAFVFADILLAAIALSLEGENPWRAALALPQRFVYRPLLSLVVWQAILRALRGAWVSWGITERVARVNLKKNT